jgi:hypothetical protein
MMMPLVSAYALWVGWGLLSANRWAHWVAIGASSLVVAWCRVDMFWALVLGQVDLGLLINGTIPALAGATIAYLLKRSTRDWFRLAARIRAKRRESGVA